MFMFIVNEFQRELIDYVQLIYVYFENLFINFKIFVDGICLFEIL